MAKKKAKVQWVKKTDLPAPVQAMLQRFETAFGLHDRGYEVTYHRSDAVFVTVQGMCDVYRLARMALHSPDINVELDAETPHSWTLRLFNSEWQIEHETRRKLPWITDPLPPDHPVQDQEYVQVREDV